MPYIKINEELPGIRGLLAFRPETAAPLGELANILLRDTEGLSPTERELIATHVSYLNDCFYCHHSHGEIACCYLEGDPQSAVVWDDPGQAVPDSHALVDQVRKDYQQAAISDKLKALLAIAGKVQQSGKSVMRGDVERARQLGATDRDIHDTVLIAAAFCLFNRYVDGLGTTAPTDMDSYSARARQVAEKGYGSHIFSSPQPV